MVEQSSKSSTLDHLEARVVELKSFPIPNDTAAQMWYLELHRELLDALISGFAEVRKEHADELASTRDTASASWHFDHHARVAPYSKAENFAPRFSDYRHEGEARFSDYRYSPEHAVDRFSDYRVKDHEGGSGLRLSDQPSAAGSRNWIAFPEPEAINDTRGQGVKRAAFQEHRGDSTPASDGKAPPVELFKPLSVTLETPCYKVLPAALLKYNIQAHWRQYDLYIVYGDQEVRVGLEEKPLALFKDLEREGKRPNFMLRKLANVTLDD